MRYDRFLRIGRALALAGMLAATLGLHLVHPLLHPSGHQHEGCLVGTGAHRPDHDSDSPHHSDGVSFRPAAPRPRNGASAGGSCLVCTFVKTRPTWLQGDSPGLREARVTRPVQAAQTRIPVVRRAHLPCQCRAPPATFPASAI